MVIGYDVRGAVSWELVEEAKRLTHPAPVRQIEGWLAELSVLVIRRADDEMADAVRLEAYASRLRSYPAGVVHDAVLGAGGRCPWRFWPAWVELQDKCDELAAPIRCAVDALRRVATEGEPEHEPREPRVTADRAAQIMEEIGFRPRRFGGGQ